VKKMFNIFVVSVFFTMCFTLSDALAKTKKVPKNIQAQQIVLSEKQAQALRNQERLLKEILWGVVFAQSIGHVDWLEFKDFSPSGWSANFSFLYILFRVLKDCNPKNIWEEGMGQTSMMTAQHVAHNNKNAHLTIIEHDRTWIDLFEKQLPQSDNILVVQLPLEKVTFKGLPVNNFQGLKDVAGSSRFDLVIVDGGDSGPRGYGRTSVLSLIPQNLEKSFVIIVDDFDRRGMRGTVREIRSKLDESKVKYGMATYKGKSSQFVIFSPNFGFLKHL
jgi:hypothetical protein